MSAVDWEARYNELVIHSGSFVAGAELIARIAALEAEVARLRTLREDDGFTLAGVGPLKDEPPGHTIAISMTTFMPEPMPPLSVDAERLAIAFAADGNEARAWQHWLSLGWARRSLARDHLRQILRVARGLP